LDGRAAAVLDMGGVSRRAAVKASGAGPLQAAWL